MRVERELRASRERVESESRASLVNASVSLWASGTVCHLQFYTQGRMTQVLRARQNEEQEL